MSRSIAPLSVPMLYSLDEFLEFYNIGVEVRKNLTLSFVGMVKNMHDKQICHGRLVHPSVYVVYIESKKWCTPSLLPPTKNQSAIQFTMDCLDVCNTVRRIWTSAIPDTIHILNPWNEKIDKAIADYCKADVQKASPIEILYHNLALVFQVKPNAQSVLKTQSIVKNIPRK